jgi:di/tricarboxylate transporter
LPELSPQQLWFFVILITAFALLITEKLRNDVVALLIVLSLTITGVLAPKDALAGFSSEPAIVVAGIFVLSAALHQTGVSDTIGSFLGRLAGGSLTRINAVIMVGVALLSAFTHHVTTTAVMLPVALTLGRERGIPASKLLMPLSFAASLGTTITIIGAPAFLIASQVLQQAGRPGLGVFTIAPIGLAITFFGTLFVLIVGRFLLPDRAGAEADSNRFRLSEYFTEVAVLEDSPFVARTVGEVVQDDRFDGQIVGWVRRGRLLRPPREQDLIQSGDVLLVRTTPEGIVAFREDAGVELNPVQQYGGDVPSPNGEEDTQVADQFVQAVVAPEADLVGRTLADIDFRRRYGAIVIGLWRRSGWLGQELSRVRLRAGDVLVLQGDNESLARVSGDRSFLMLVPFHGTSRLRGRAPMAAGIMLGTILAAAFNLLTIEMAALAGAVAVVLTRCLTPRQAYYSIDQRVFVFIAGAIPLGTAMRSTGASEMMAQGLQGAVSGWSHWMVLLAIFAIVGVLTQFMSDAATTAIFAPVAVALADALGRPPEAFVVTVAMAAVAAFLTPIGHHGNLLIYGPGGYRFADFVRVGTPLTILVGIVVTLVASWMWPA